MILRRQEARRPHVDHCHIFHYAKDPYVILAGATWASVPEGRVIWHAFCSVPGRHYGPLADLFVTEAGAMQALVDAIQDVTGLEIEGIE